MDEGEAGGPFELDNGMGIGDGSESTWSCSFPPSFGPCSNSNHIHRMKVRDPCETQLESVSRIGDGEKGIFVPYTGERLMIECVRVGSGAIEEERVEDSSSTSSVVEGVRVELSTLEGERVEELASDLPSEKKSLVIDDVSAEAGVETDEEQSDETLYRINSAAITDKPPCGGDELLVEAMEGVMGKIGRIDSGCASIGYDENAEDGIEDSEETLYLINSRMVDKGQFGADSVERREEKTLNEEDTNLWEEEILGEAIESNRVWGRGGISFDSSNEEEVMARLVDRKLGGKKQADVRPKKQRQLWKPRCIQERTLTTRTLSLGIKSKLK
ncbi:hypothetical protein PIB30_044351 [Stylosanthes scabra]|uniref:Uncharacterized protein n=1 Tax=Stylosanthes scabra TaxID=79078 RepID=A0ABU6SFP8_9FABA|nr:hypothetical protein [Stylosanthes scabra]